MNKERSDYVTVRLSEVGKKLAAGGTLEVTTSTHRFIFRAGEDQEVTRAFDWERVLAKKSADGEPIFECVGAEPANSTSKTDDPAEDPDA
jgi:hypothetical protein